MFRILTDFIQEDVIVAMLRDKLEARTVARNVVDVKTNTQLGKGSSYKVPGVGDLTVNAYDGTAITPQDVTQSNAIILMDQFPLVNFYLEDGDIDEASALSVAGAFANEAATRIAQTIDKDVLGRLFIGATADAANLGATTTPKAIVDADDALEYIEAFATSLSESNVETDSVIVVPSFLGIKLAKALGTTVYNEAIAGQIQSGRVGELFGVEIYTSNNLAKGVAGGLAAAEFSVVGGKRSSFHLIEGLTTVKSGQSETKPASWNQFGQIYGRNFSQALAWKKGVITK